GVVGAFVGIDRTADFGPADIGANATETMQPAAGASVPPEQLSKNFVNSDGFVPVKSTAPMMRLPFPELVTETCWEELGVPEFRTVPVCAGPGEPTSWLPKTRLGGSRVAAAWIPRPFMGTRSGLDGALVGMLNDTVLSPVELGANETSTAQVAPGATVAPEH